MEFWFVVAPECGSTPRELETLLCWERGYDSKVVIGYRLWKLDGNFLIVSLFLIFDF